jgi:hypothetical protein
MPFVVTSCCASVRPYSVRAAPSSAVVVARAAAAALSHAPDAPPATHRCQAGSKSSSSERCAGATASVQDVYALDSKNAVVGCCPPLPLPLPLPLPPPPPLLLLLLLLLLPSPMLQQEWKFVTRSITAAPLQGSITASCRPYSAPSTLSSAARPPAAAAAPLPLTNLAPQPTVSRSTSMAITALPSRQHPCSPATEWKSLARAAVPPKGRKRGRHERCISFTRPPPPPPAALIRPSADLASTCAPPTSAFDGGGTLPSAAAVGGAAVELSISLTRTRCSRLRRASPSPPPPPPPKRFPAFSVSARKPLTLDAFCAASAARGSAPLFFSWLRFAAASPSRSRYFSSALRPFSLTLASLPCHPSRARPRYFFNASAACFACCFFSNSGQCSWMQLRHMLSWATRLSQQTGQCSRTVQWLGQHCNPLRCFGDTTRPCASAQQRRSRLESPRAEATRNCMVAGASL